MIIQTFGSGRPNCKQLEENAREAVSTLGIEADFEKITDTNQIVEMGVMRTPGLVFDGKVQKSGKVFTPVEIEETIKAYTP